MGHSVDITNEKFGRLVAIKVVGSSNQGRLWMCGCSCGKAVTVPAGQLRAGGKQSCGCLAYETHKRQGKNLSETRAINLAGQQIGSLRVIKPVPHKRNAGRYWICECTCGKKVSVSGYKLRCGHYSTCWHKSKTYKNSRGYVMCYRPKHPNAAKNGVLPEHKLVMSKHLGRPLTSGEIVHHKNGDKADNRLGNLELCLRGKNAHPPGQRIGDITKFALEHLKLYAPYLLRSNE